MDYWEYLAHSQTGGERAGHRYYARELVGSKGGKNVYRYFYTAEEYTAYKQQKGTPGHGTYAETGRSKDAFILPKGTTKARQRAESQARIADQKHQMNKDRIAGEKKAMDRARVKANIASQKKKMDRKRTEKLIQKAKREMDKKRIRKQKAAMTKKRIRKQKTAMDRARIKANVNAQKHQLDNIRQRPYYQPLVKR